MFGFANGLLAFLALAAVLDFLPVLRHRRAPAVWWGEERLLFTTRYASVRQKYGAWAFLLGVMVYEFIVVFNNSMARENWPWLQTRVSPVLDWVMYLCFGFKILLGTKYNGRSMVCAGLLYFVARWVYFNGQNIWWLGLCVALLAAKDVPLRRVMKAFLACGVPTLTLVELLQQSVGEEQIEAFLRADNEIAATCLQVNTLLSDAQEAEQALTQLGIAFEKHPWLDGCYLVRGTGNLAQLELFSAEHPDVRPETAEFLTLLREQTERLTQMTKTLLEMSNLQQVARNERIQLAPMVEEIFADLAPLTDKRGITLTADGDGVMTGSDALIYRLLFNLTENAVKYNRPGGSVRVCVTQEPEKLRIRVSDTGCGIPEKYQQSIFQPFFRVDKSRSREYGGAGLGLSLAWEIANLHGGYIWVEKSSEKGTTIAVELPVQ